MAFAWKEQAACCARSRCALVRLLELALGLYRVITPYWGYMGNNGKENGNYYLKKIEYILGLYRGYWGYIGIMEKKMETTIMYWGCIASRSLLLLGRWLQNAVRAWFWP